MIPVLLDVLTIFFIVAGMALLWLNLCAWRRRTVPMALPDRISDAEIARFRAQAEECLEEAARATSETDQEAWMGMATKWIKLIEDAE